MPRITAEEKEFLRCHYPSLGAERIARLWGRPRWYVEYRAERLGLHRFWPQDDPAIQARVRQLHAKGLGVYKIACVLRINQQLVWKIQRRLGLPPNGKWKGKR